MTTLERCIRSVRAWSERVHGVVHPDLLSDLEVVLEAAEDVVDLTEVLEELLEALEDD